MPQTERDASSSRFEFLENIFGIDKAARRDVGFRLV